MTLFQATTYAFATIGVVSVIYGVFKWLASHRGEDGPIRVKGGSITIENDDFDWEKDDGDGKKEYHYKGRPNRWRVTVLKNGSNTSINGMEARRVRIQTINTAGQDGTVVFRANGAARVMDEDGRFTASGKVLTDNSAGARVKKVIARRSDGTTEEVSFAQGDEAKVELVPLT
jgi:hypothetical protein